MKKNVLAVLFGAFISILLFSGKPMAMRASAIVSFETKVEEITEESPETGLTDYIDFTDGCTYFKVNFYVAGNNSLNAVGMGGLAFKINKLYFDAVLIPEENANGTIEDRPPFEYNPDFSSTGFAISRSFNETATEGRVCIAFVGISDSYEDNGFLFAFLVKTKPNVVWNNQGEIVTGLEIDKWETVDRNPISFTSPQSYLHAVTRIIGDLNGDGETDVQDVQLLNAALYDGFLNIPYTDEVSSYSAHITRFSSCTNMIVTVAGTTYVILGMADADQNHYINSGDASAFLQYYTDSLAHLDTGDYIGCPYTFYIEIPYTA